MAIVEVPDARLYCETRGSGPVLLLIPGGPADGDAFAGVAPLLANQYTVITYDPRGLSRSTRTDDTVDVPVQTQAEDARLLLTSVGDGPVYVFGGSGGAITGLALVTAYPTLVDVLVAHEPPITDLLPDGPEFRTMMAGVYRVLAESGPAAAMRAFLTGAGLIDPADPPVRPPDPAAGAAARETTARMISNVELFLAHMSPAITDFWPDVAALTAARTRVVVGSGTTSLGQPAQRAAVALASRLGMPIVEFPGGHGGYAEHPDAFADLLRRVLTEAQPTA